MGTGMDDTSEEKHTHMLFGIHSDLRWSQRAQSRTPLHRHRSQGNLRGTYGKTNEELAHDDEGKTEQKATGKTNIGRERCGRGPSR